MSPNNEQLCLKPWKCLLCPQIIHTMLRLPWEKVKKSITLQSHSNVMDITSFLWNMQTMNLFPLSTRNLAIYQTMAQEDMLHHQPVNKELTLLLWQNTKNIHSPISHCNSIMHYIIFSCNIYTFSIFKFLPYILFRLLSIKN